MNSPNSISLVSGNPSSDKKAASYSRFILPFSCYCKQIEGKTIYENGEEKDEDRKHKQKIYWQEIDNKDNNHRRKYFTKETSKVLFDQTKWFKLEGLNDCELLVGNDCLVLLNPPKLILFEFSKTQQESLLRTGFLVLEFYFKSDASLENLLELNEVIRYKQKPFDEYDNDRGLRLNKEFCEKVKKVFGKQGVQIEECQKEDVRSNKSQKQNFFPYWNLFLENQTINCLDETSYLITKLDIDIYADDRSFVWTCAVTKNGSENLPDYSKLGWQAEKYGYWVKLLNVDYPKDKGEYKTKLNKLTEFERGWVTERTYHRWEECGSFYGFSYHSGAALIPSWDNPPLWRHFGEMYFDIFLLLLYIRVTLFRFSNKLTEISIDASEEPDEKKTVEKWSSDFKSLRWDFTLFTNLYQFPLISNQQQGIEMYELARKALDIKALYDEVKEEVHNGQEFISQLVQQSHSDNSLKLTQVATVGLALSIALAFLATKLGDNLAYYLAGENGILRREGGWDIRWGLLILLTFAAFFILKLVVWIWTELNVYWGKWK